MRGSWPLTKLILVLCIAGGCSAAAVSAGGLEPPAEKNSSPVVRICRSISCMNMRLISLHGSHAFRIFGLVFMQSTIPAPTFCHSALVAQYG